jgi:prevent-host-death family protein
VTEINVKEARQNLRAVLERVAAGEEVVLVRHGRPVARLVPPAPAAERLPSMASLRRSVRIAGRPLSAEITAGDRAAGGAAERSDQLELGF